MSEDIELLRLRAKAKAKAARERGRQTAPQTTSASQNTPPPGNPSVMFEPLKQQLFAPGRKLEEVKAQEGKVPLSETVGGVINALAMVPGAALSPIGQLPGGQYALEAIASPFTLGTMLFRGGKDVVGRGLSALGIPDPKLGAEATQALEMVGGTVLAGPLLRGGARITGKAVAPIQESAGLRQARTAAKIGSILNVGKNVSEAGRGGQFMVDFKIPTSKTGYKTGRFGVTETQSAGAAKAKAISGQLARELDQKIIQPATRAGEQIQGNQIYESALKIYEAAKEEFLPNRATLRKMERELVTLKETIDKNNGVLTPAQAQAYKVKNNAILADLYKKRSAGTLTEKQLVREKIILDNTENLRRQIEELHPNVARINWTEGAGADVARALDAFFESKLGRDPTLTRGSGITSAAAGRKTGMTLFGLTELATYAPFRVAYNKLLNRMYGKIAGSSSPFIRPGQTGSYIPPQFPSAGSQTTPPVVLPPP